MPRKSQKIVGYVVFDNSSGLLGKLDPSEYSLSLTDIDIKGLWCHTIGTLFATREAAKRAIKRSDEAARKYWPNGLPPAWAETKYVKPVRRAL